MQVCLKIMFPFANNIARQCPCHIQNAGTLSIYLLQKDHLACQQTWIFRNTVTFIVRIQECYQFIYCKKIILNVSKHGVFRNTVVYYLLVHELILSFCILYCRFLNKTEKTFYSTLFNIFLKCSEFCHPEISHHLPRAILVQKCNLL